MTVARTPLLSVKDLTKHFGGKHSLLGKPRPIIPAVDAFSLDIHAGETVGLVGESGCGKTTAGRTILRLLEPTSGSVHFRSRTYAEARGPERADVVAADSNELRLLRRDMQIIFQDPYSALNPRLTLASNVGEPLRANKMGNRGERRERVAELLERVGLAPEMMDRYPHEFSGGQRQRAVIARALTLDPSFVVADEAVSALDVSIQAQVLNILLDLQASRNLAFLFIAHDLAVVKYVSHRVAVMYLGRVVELSPTDELFADPRHPYTEALMSAVPPPHRRKRPPRITLAGDVPNPAAPPSGCHFRTRCRYAKDRCVSESPALREIRPGHLAACHYAEKLTLRPASVR
ncbi:MAG: ATP-binding cassette domain-containing protein [Rhizobiaceae bacterium]|nr:ATP-binding cassette domain-containing protein [Rhizobiaceae bacterium]